MDKIRIQQQDFDLTTEVALAKNADSNIGAAVSFVGFVRDLADVPIKKMTLEHYPQMTEKALLSIANQAHQRWELGNITIIHRVGDLPVNAQIVLVITNSKHRQSAFASCEFVMDYLKTQAPFWKKEYSENSSHWVASKATDADKTDNW
ncbi:Molybdenum cofactor biosynthesis protein MoaE [hydrothermal vent metagenome]|uniref:Molybdenum cofactor biosynthesis protein MoaE n=1 Tax=hydrothermal vent metagenome TaxID=652676 RepID=A0A1W1DUS7_9ZZZZ